MRHHNTIFSRNLQQSLVNRFIIMTIRHFKVIACNVFMREICIAIAESENVIDPEFTELGEHVQSDRLRAAIQSRIDAADTGSHAYDAILLAYGLCGNAAVGLIARDTPLVIPRAHDCCTILLGSRQAFERYFGDNPSRPFSSAGTLDRGDYYLQRDEDGARIRYGDQYAELLRQYGKENADYIWETMHPPALREIEKDAVFIDIPETSHLDHGERFAQQAAADGKTCTKLTGDLRLLRGLLRGDWPAEDYLVIPPGFRSIGRYDTRYVIECEPADD